ncbi:MAG: NAD(P)H-hydrate dehydratase [Elusimicrobia bacterium]|nr:NAD(P)H-hydrate dehydratase [Elusimicrobiota bacterium]MDE2313124.1 NAD(P)H-hydrate dehydratase [Elusimicrobiota bacterium]
MIRPPRPKILSRRELRAALTPRRPGDHKGVFGHVLVVAGSRGMAGAAILSARAAARSGAGLVTSAVPRGLQDLVAGQVPEAMTLGLAQSPAGAFSPAAAGELARAAENKNFTAMAVGPGLSHRPEAAKFLLRLLAAVKTPAVLDADALNILSACERGEVRRLLARPGGCVVTPHPGEMARALRTTTARVEAARPAAALALSRRWGCAVLLKGRRTLVTDGWSLWMNATGGPALAKGGSGDVLTGLLAGLWAQRLASGRGPSDAAQSAALAAWLHGKAGEAAGRLATPWASTASLVVEKFPEAFKAL